MRWLMPNTRPNTFLQSGNNLYINISEKIMNTMFLLMAEYGSATVTLEQVCEKYFGMKPATAEKRAALGALPIPTFRAAESQKAPRMIHIQDLANHIDAQLKKGRDLLEQMQSGNN